MTTDFDWNEILKLVLHEIIVTKLIARSVIIHKKKNSFANNLL